MGNDHSIVRSRELKEVAISTSRNRLSEPKIDDPNPSQSSSVTIDDPNSSVKIDAATGSSTRPSGEFDDKVTEPSAVLVGSASTPSQTPESSFPEGTDLLETSEPSPVSVRGRSAAKEQRKENEISVPKRISKSCPAPKKRQSHTIPEEEDDGLSD